MSRASSFALALMCGCGAAAPTPQRASNPPVASAAPAPTSAPSAAPIEGMPPPGRAWTARDYAECAAALAKGPLPRVAGPHADVFARMVSRENLATFREAGQLGDFIDFQSKVGAVFKAYVLATAKDPTFGQEELALAGMIIHTTVVGWTLSDAFLLGLDPHEPQFATRLAGMDRVRSGTADIVRGTLAMQAEPATAPYSSRFWRDAGADWALLVHRLGPGDEDAVLDGFASLERAKPTPELAATRAALVGLPAANVTIAKDGAADVHDSPPLAVSIVVDPAAPSRAVEKVLGRLRDRGVRNFELRLPNDAHRTRVLVLRGAPSDDIGLTALVVTDGVSLKAKGGNVARGCEKTGPGLAVPNRKDGKRDLAALASCATKLKRAAPASRSLRVVATPSVPFGDVLAVAAALRGPSLDEFPDLSFFP